MKRMQPLQQIHRAFHQLHYGQKRVFQAAFLVTIILLLSACKPSSSMGGTALPTAIAPSQGKASPTSDLCDKDSIGKEIVKVHNVLREYEQVLFLAQNALPSQMMSPLMKMQDIRHQGEIQEVPACLQSLKTKRDNYMGARIIHVAHFMGGVAKEQLDKEGEVVNSYQNDYKTELAGLLAKHAIAPLIETTPAAPPNMPVPPTKPAVTPAAQQPTPAPQQPPSAETGVMAVNEQGRDLLLRQMPNSEAPPVGSLKNTEKLPAAGKSEDGVWLQVKLPNNQNAWVERELVRLEGDENALPVIKP